MDRNRILVIGPNHGLRSSKLLSLNINLDELSVIVWYPVNLYQEWQKSDHAPQSRFKISKEKIVALVEWVRQGHCLCVVGLLPYHDIDYTVQSTKFTYRPILDEPFSGITFEPINGDNIEFCGPTSMELPRNFASSIGLMKYQGLLKGSQLTPLLRVSRGRKGVDQIVGGYKKLGDGLIIFGPALNIREGERGAIAENITWDDYHLSLAELSHQVSFEPTEVLPDWATDFQLGDEQAALQEIKQLNTQIDELRGKVSDQEGIVTASQQLKHLFTASGDTFAQAVASALRELGLRVIEGPKGRSDLIATDGKRLASIEAKGLEGTAKVRNVTQTERWVSDVRSVLTSEKEEIAADHDLVAYANKLAELGIDESPGITAADVKGLMIIGTHRKVPLDQRNDKSEPDFPHAVEREISRDRFCAFTGLQLLGFLIQARNDAQQKAAILDRLFSSNGVLSDQTGWRKFLHHVANAIPRTEEPPTA